MQIHGLNKTTLLDFPQHVAATVFTGGCNFRCPFCHNKDLVLNPDSQPRIREEEVFRFLEKRKGILTGVCITGGEPALQPGLVDFMLRIKELGFLVKLDTNGSMPDVVKRAVKMEAVDYVAMDLKSCREEYAQAAGIPDLDLKLIQETVAFLMEEIVQYEFRTTVVKELHSRKALEDIARWIRGCRAYYLQAYADSPGVIRPGFHSYSKEELEELAQLARQYVPNTAVRGI